MNAYAKLAFLVIFTLLVFLSFPKLTLADWCTVNDAPQGTACGGANFCSGGNQVNDWGYCDRSSGTSTCFITEPAKVHTTCTVPAPFLQCGAGANACVNHPAAIESNHTVFVTPIAGCSSGSCTATYNCDDQGIKCGECGNPACPPPPSPSPSPSPPPFVTISGTVVDKSGTGINGVSITVSNGTTDKTITTSSAGTFSVTSFIRQGDHYAVRAPSTPVTFGTVTYSSRSPSDNYENQHAGAPHGDHFDCGTGCNFIYSPQTFTIGGAVTKSTGGGLSGVTINQGVTNPPSCNIGTTTTDSSGNYRFNNVSHNLSFCLRPPSVSGYTGPSPASYENLTATTNKLDYNFTYTPAVIFTPLTVSCAAYNSSGTLITSANVGATVTWKAAPLGGTHPFTYSWSGSPDSVTGSSSSTTKTYTTSGSKTATVTVTDSSIPIQTQSASCSITITAPVPTVSLTANPTSIANNTSSTLSWTTTSCTTANSCSCSASGAWSGSKSISGGSQSTGNLTGPANYTYTLTCTNSSGTSLPSTANVSVGGATCTPEGDSAFCKRLGKNCGSVTGTDNCGTNRTVTSCGTCSGTQTCGGGGTPNVCGGGTSSSSCPWIQTFGGDVHSNTNINTPCGP